MTEQTLARVSRSIAADHVQVVVVRAHDRYYRPLFGEMPEHNLVIQPDNRGTAAAILHALLRLSKLAPDARVVLLPSDHFVSDDGRLMRHIDLAFNAVGLRPELTVLLGIAADSAETAYGWIEPGQPAGSEHASILTVRQFWEKPSAELAGRLLDRGCLWNSFIVVARVSTLLHLMIEAQPELFHAFSRVSSTLLTSAEAPAIEKLYASLGNVDFSHDVLAGHSINLAVLPVRGCEWSDLGGPKRVLEVIRRQGVRTGWRVA